MEYLSSTGKSYDVDIPDAGLVFGVNGRVVDFTDYPIESVRMEYFNLAPFVTRPCCFLDYLINRVIIPDYVDYVSVTSPADRLQPSSVTA